MNRVHKFWFSRMTVKYTQWGIAPNHAQNRLSESVNCKILPLREEMYS